MLQVEQPGPCESVVRHSPPTIAEVYVVVWLRESVSAGPYLFPSDLNPTGHLKKLKSVWKKTLRRAKIPYFRIYDLRSAYATRLSAGGVADEWVTQLLRQSDAQVLKKYSQMKLRMKREALEKLNRRANEMTPVGEADAFSTAPLCTEAVQ